jgi:hypothetical protein
MKVCFSDNSDDFGYGLDGLGYDVIFISYNVGYYDGDGYALGVKDGKVFGGGLSHCSCYGPDERLRDMDEINMDDDSVRGELALMEGDKHGAIVLEMYRKFMEEV